MADSATNTPSESTNRLLNDHPHRDLDGGGISIKCLRKIFKSYGEFTASQPWELIVTTLTGLMLTLIWAGDLGNHVMDTGKMARETPDSNHGNGHSGCASGSKEAILQLSNNDDYSGDGTQMEKIIMAFARCLAVVHLLYRFKRIHRIGSTFLMKIAATYLFVTFVMFFLVAYTLSGHDTLRYRLLYDSWFLVILFVDLPRVTRMAQFALSSSHHRRISENVSHGMFVLAPTFTLETIAKILLVSFGSFTGIPKVEVYAWFAVVLTFVNFIVYMTIYPAALSLILELMYSADGRARWDVRQIIQSLPSEDGYSPAVHKVRIVGTAALIIFHVVLRRPITFDLTASSNNYSTSVYLLYLIGNNFEQLFYIFIMTAMAVKYLFYEDMDEVSELRRTYIEELNRSYEVERSENEDVTDDSYINNSSLEEQINGSLSENIKGNNISNETETDEGISVRSISITDGSGKEDNITPKVGPSKRKHLTSSGTICRVGGDSSSESACSEINLTSDILKSHKNSFRNSDSMSSSDVEQEPHPASSISSRRSSASIGTPKEVRTVEECIEILNTQEVKNLTDDEILQLIDTKNIRAFELEKILRDHLRGVEIRRKMVMRQTNTSTATMKEIPYRNYDYERVLGACAENVIGYMTLPLGVVGPLKINNKVYTVPMATTEGCLIASTNRGCSALRSCGVKTVVTDDKMTRAPAVRFESIHRAAEVKRWIEDKNNMDILKSKFDSTSRFARLKAIFPRQQSRTLYLRFEASTGDAMGMNMVSKATEFTLKHLKDEFPDMEIITISSNMCTDKKPSAINWITGRGKSVVAEALIPKAIVEETLKTTASHLVDLNDCKNKTGSALAGSIGGNNAHAANIVTAIYIATGQDAAQNVCSSMCSTDMEIMGNGDLYITCTMPCIEVGTVGGGTILAAQSSCLEMLGVKGSDPENPGKHARQLAEIVCATVLAGELSLMSALAAGHLVKSHLRHNRSTAQLPVAHSTPLFTLKEHDMNTSSLDASPSMLSSTLCAALLSQQDNSIASHAEDIRHKNTS